VVSIDKPIEVKLFVGPYVVVVITVSCSIRYNHNAIQKKSRYLRVILVEIIVAGTVDDESIELSFVVC
jgi:hypothetical protein